jgi:hypothetical protein
MRPLLREVVEADGNPPTRRLSGGPAAVRRWCVILAGRAGSPPARSAILGRLPWSSLAYVLVATVRTVCRRSALAPLTRRTCCALPLLVSSSARHVLSRWRCTVVATCPTVPGPIFSPRPVQRPSSRALRGDGCHGRLGAVTSRNIPKQILEASLSAIYEMIIIYFQRFRRSYQSRSTKRPTF